MWVQNGANNLWHNYFFLRGVRAENRQLKEQIEQMRLEQVRLNEDAAQAHRLQALLAFKEQYVAKTVPAQVIGSSASDLSRSVYIDKGSNQGIVADMPVITAGGIVGKVLRVYPSTSLVLMINDQTSGVGVLLEKSRLQGVLHGTADGELVVERVMSDEQVAPGDTVLSSGGDQIFPKGLAVGTVNEVSPGKEMFLKIKVRPAADLSRLEEVLVVTEKQELAPMAEAGGRVRAADILAERLPSVPDKPPVAPAAAAKPGNIGAKPATNSLAGAALVPENLRKVAQKTAVGISTGAGGTTPAASATGSNTVVPSIMTVPTTGGSGSNASTEVRPAKTSNAASSITARPLSAQAKPIPVAKTPEGPPNSSQPPAAEDPPH